MTHRSRNKGLMLSFPECIEPAASVATAAGLDFAEIEAHHFPDGESRVALPGTVAEHVFIYRSLDQPNEKLVELVLAAAAARKLGAVRLALVAPYLCYMRQDKAFHPGEAVSQRIIGNLLADYFDEVITVDPHLHRVDRLEAAVPVKRALALSATDAMSNYLNEHLENPILIGPDEESEQWVASIARQNELEFYVARKQRFGDSDVSVSLPQAVYRGRHVVLVDDMVSTGHTLAATSVELARHQPASITAMITHALFVNDALARIAAAGVHDIWSCDSIRHATNRITLSGILARGVMSLRVD